MRPDPVRRAQKKIGSLERLEDRLAMNAEPVFDFWAQDNVAAEALRQYDPFAAAAANVHQQTGVASAQANYGFTGARQTVVVIDTGIAWDHYALGRGFGTGYRIVGGWDFAENDANPYDDGPAGFHGTHVAGIIGSSDSRYSGVAPGVDIVALRVFNDSGAGKFEWVEQALRWVHDHRDSFENPITTVNLSLGAKWNADTLPNWATLEEELRVLYDDGIFTSVAAGNDFANVKTPGLSYPAVSPYVVAVSSVTSAGVFSSFSQRADRILAAPGQSITSTVPDWLYGGNGIPNDFGAVSGTSMAAPYVAGAAVLVREAMQFVGYATITQGTIYNHLRQTADVFLDTATQANYFRINVGRAIDALMPADDYGDTTATAHSLGSLQTVSQLSGKFGTKTDADAFVFTAAASGVVELGVSGAAASTARIQISGAAASQQNGRWSFRVVAGQQYSFTLAGGGSVGAYSAALTLAADPPAATPAVDWGRITQNQFDRQVVSGESSYTLTASQTGLLTLESLGAAAGNLQLTILDVNRQVLAQSNSSSTSGRLDVSVTAGATYLVRVSGQAASASFRLTNLVAQQNGTVQVTGAAGNDTCGFAAGEQLTVTLNGVNYRFDPRSVNSISFADSAGLDVITLQGSAGNDRFTADPSTATLTGSGYTVTARGFDRVTAIGGGGSDAAYLNDSAGNDELIARPTETTLRGATFANTAADFGRVYAIASRGSDIATFYDSSGSDRFYGWAHQSLLAGAGFYLSGAGFDRVTAISSGGADYAYLYDSLGNDLFVAGPRSATLSGAGFENSVQNFSRVYGYATLGNDEVQFSRAAATDAYFSSSNSASLTGSGFYNVATNFRQANVIAPAVAAVFYDELGTPPSASPAESTDPAPIRAQLLEMLVGYDFAIAHDDDATDTLFAEDF